MMDERYIKERRISISAKKEYWENDSLLHERLE
jgi:hypothetical protein